MARSAQVRDVRVLLATLFLISDRRERDRPGTQDAIKDLNDQIRGLARSLDLGRVVDLERAFGGDESLLGSDGLHPNAAGYEGIAETFRDAIVSRYETDVTAATAQKTQ
jgi:lysophospholipase L1-like esterase